MKLDKAEDAHFMGKRVGDMDREELLEVIQYLQDACIRSEDAHKQTLDTWSAIAHARSTFPKSIRAEGNNFID